MPTYGSPLTYNQALSFNGRTFHAQCSYGGGADAYAFTRYTAPDGRWFGRAEVRANDPGISTDAAAGRDRSELQDQAKLARGAHWWLSVSFKIATTETPTGDYQDLLQVHGTANAGQSGGSPLFALEWKTATEALQFRRRWNPTGLDADYTDEPIMWADSGPADRNRFYNLVVEIVEGWSNDGLCNVWLDGVQVVNLSGINIGYNDVIGPYWKLGIYRGGSATDTLAVEYANPEIKDDGTSLFARVAAPISTADAPTAEPIKVSKQVAFAILLGPEGVKVAKQTAFAQLIYPKIDVSKQLDYGLLGRASVHIGKQVVYALLREPPAPIEGAVDFTASASLGLPYALDPELQVFGSITFQAAASLSLTYDLNPPFACEQPAPTIWAREGGTQTSWNCAPPTATAWACATDTVSADENLLLTVAGAPLLFINGREVKRA
jgi:hypothetical protein